MNAKNCAITGLLSFVGLQNCRQEARPDPAGVVVLSDPAGVALVWDTFAIPGWPIVTYMRFWWAKLSTAILGFSNGGFSTASTFDMSGRNRQGMLGPE